MASRVDGSVTADAGRSPLGAGLGLVIAFLVLTTAVLQQRLDHLDLAARAFVHQDQHPEIHALMEGVSWVGGRPGQVAVIVLGSLFLWARLRQWAVALPLMMAGVGILQLSAKWAMNRPRPNLDPWGFPSAHVFSLVVLCGIFVHLVGKTSGRPSRQRLAAAVGAVIVTMVAFSRMYLDVHWLSDILGGLTAGLAYLLVAIWAVESAPRYRVILGRAAAHPASERLVPAIASPVADSLMAAVPNMATAPATSAFEGS